MTRLLLIRHGQSTWNASGRWQGQEDPPLTDVGRRQAAEASAAIGAVDAIFSSTLERARVTAEIVAEQIGVGPVVSLPGLVERHAGEWQGLTRAEIEAAYPGFLDAGHRPPGWESDEALNDRAMTALQAIAVAVGGEEGAGIDVDVVVVTHGGLIYQIEGSLGAPFERLPNLGGRWLAHEGGRWRLGDRVDLLGGVDVTIPDQI
ncbi:MAG: histidine phosphatase family protein [Acidimicrobiales bacterium]